MSIVSNINLPVAVAIEVPEKNFVKNERLEKMFERAENLDKCAKMIDVPELSTTDFDKMRDEIKQYIIRVNALSLSDLDIIIESDFFTGRVSDFIIKVFDGPITRLIPMYLAIPKTMLKNLDGDVLCETMSSYIFSEFCRVGGVGILNHSIRKSRSDFFKSLFGRLEILDAHCRVVQLLGSKNKMRKTFSIYRMSLWKCVSMDQRRVFY